MLCRVPLLDRINCVPHHRPQLIVLLTTSLLGNFDTDHHFEEHRLNMIRELHV